MFFCASPEQENASPPPELITGARWRTGKQALSGAREKYPGHAGFQQREHGGGEIQAGAFGVPKARRCQTWGQGWTLLVLAAHHGSEPPLAANTWSLQTLGHCNNHSQQTRIYRKPSSATNHHRRLGQQACNPGAGWRLPPPAEVLPTGPAGCCGQGVEGWRGALTAAGPWPGWQPGLCVMCCFHLKKALGMPVPAVAASGGTSAASSAVRRWALMAVP
jgi:hypothetical protein